MASLADHAGGVPVDMSPPADTYSSVAARYVMCESLSGGWWVTEECRTVSQRLLWWVLLARELPGS